MDRWLSTPQKPVGYCWRDHFFSSLFWLLVSLRDLFLVHFIIGLYTLSCNSDILFDLLIIVSFLVCPVSLWSPIRCWFYLLLGCTKLMQANASASTLPYQKHCISSPVLWHSTYSLDLMMWQKALLTIIREIPFLMIWYLTRNKTRKLGIQNPYMSSPWLLPTYLCQ